MESSGDSARLGGIDVRLSPMAGYTNAPMRVMAIGFGASAVYTEMAGVAGLVHEKSDETWQLLETLPEEAGKVYAHLYGSDPDQFASAAEKIAATGRFVGIDVNAGCPVPKVTACGAGAALMADPKKIGRIVAAARRASGMAVSVKTRLGFDRSRTTVFDVLDAVQEAGGASLAVHGRYKSQGHAGEVGLDVVAEVRRRAKIPVFGNGGVADAALAREYVRRTSVAGLLVGQAAIGHPWVFREIAEGRSFEPGESHAAYLSLDEIREVFREHLEREFRFAAHIAGKYPLSAPDYTPEEIAAIRFRVHLFAYVTGLRGSSYMRGRMAMAHTLDDCRRAVDGCLECERRYRARRGRV